MIIVRSGRKVLDRIDCFQVSKRGSRIIRPGGKRIDHVQVSECATRHEISVAFGRSCVLRVAIDQLAVAKVVTVATVSGCEVCGVRFNGSARNRTDAAHSVQSKQLTSSSGSKRFASRPHIAQY